MVEIFGLFILKRGVDNAFAAQKVDEKKVPKKGGYFKEVMNEM